MMNVSTYFLPSIRNFFSHVILLFLLLFCSQSAKAQDIHFSQFYQSPFNLNPALTGQFNGSYRFVANQRTQWRSVTTPYSTFGLGVDARGIGLGNRMKDNESLLFLDKLNLGLSFFHDRVGDSQLTSSLINFALSRDILIDDDARQRIVPGLIIGLTSMRIDYSNLTYDAQWNGLFFDPSINPNETYARSSRGYFNLHVGLGYFYDITTRERISVGMSIFNLSNPKQSFFDDGYVRLDTRIHLHGQYRFPVKDNWLAEPMVLFSSQGTYKEYLVGSLVHYVLEEKPWANRTLYAGFFGRIKDAGYFSVGMQYDVWNVGLSYDINTSNLRPASNGRGGFEFSVIYIIPPKPKVHPLKVCPDYM